MVQPVRRTKRARPRDGIANEFSGRAIMNDMDGAVREHDNKGSSVEYVVTTEELELQQMAAS